MKREQKESLLEFVDHTMSKLTRDALIEMSIQSVRAFQSCSINEPMVKRFSKIESLMGLMAVESAVKHHSLLSARATEQIEITAHLCAEAMTRTMLDEYDEELSLEQNLELWKLKKA